MNSQGRVADWLDCRTLTGCGVQAHEILSTGASFIGMLCGFPVFSAPPATVQTLDGYEGGAFRPEQPAAGYAVVNTPFSRGVSGVAKKSAVEVGV